MDTLSQDIDPITTEVIRKKMTSIVEQIETNIVRTAYSPLIYEYKDFAVGVVDCDGRLMVQGCGGIPVFSANLLGLAVRDGLELYGLDGFERGDIVICNHSGVLGQHLNNVAMYTPIFAPDGHDRILGFMAIVVHWADVGGRTIGSFTSLQGTDIYQEGIQFRTLKLWRKGEPVPEIFRVIESNTRFPAVVLGDIDSQIAGCLMGRDLFEEMVAEYGATTIHQVVEIIWEQSERAARTFIEGIPDGTYSAEAFIDNDGNDLVTPIRMPVTVIVSGGKLTVDYSQVSEQVRGPFNSGRNGGGITAARMAFNFLVNPDEGANDGFYRPVDVLLPDGKFLSAAPGAAMGRYNAPLSTLIDTIINAMGAALPDKVAAGHHADIGGHMFTGIDPVTGETFKTQDTSLGGWGALHDRDGPGPFKTYVHGDTLNVPAELQEAKYPLRLDRFALRPDSGGAGTYRGGLGTEKTYTTLVPCRVSLNFDRTLCAPWGLGGGASGATGEAIVERTGEAPRVVKKGEIDLAAGDRVRLYFGGGGGYGPAAGRERASVARDVALGYVSPQSAERDYDFTGEPIETGEKAPSPR
ncbi:MAG: hydantoinase B/oxoprolinase family protein [Alphaproteobacteria bacterium]